MCINRKQVTYCSITNACQIEVIMFRGHVIIAPEIVVVILSFFFVAIVLYILL